MMPRVPDNETRQRLLDVADELFSRRGFAGVTLRDIAEALDMHHASLYYYAPRGKEQLFIEVMERNFVRHRAGLTAAIAEAGDHIVDQVHAVAQWLASQPLIDMGRMRESDMRALPPEAAERLMQFGYDALREPIVQALSAARSKGDITAPDLNLTAMALISLVESIHSIPVQYVQGQQLFLARQLADLLLNGLFKRE